MGDAADEQGSLAVLLDALPERVARYRLPDLVVLECNEAKAAEYGLTALELRGRSLADLLPDASVVQLRAQLARLTPEAPILTSVVQQGDRWIEWVDQLVVAAPGPEVISVGRDVTDRHAAETRLRESEHRFTTAMEEAPIGMALVDLDGRLLRVNPALCVLVGRSEAELVGLSTVDVTHPEDVEKARAYGQQLLAPDERAPVSIEKRFVRPDGTVVWGLLKVSLIRDGDGTPRYQVGQVVDITDRVEREAELQRMVRTEHAAVERLRELDEMKNTFLSAVSHELRTPLTAVQGFAELLHRRHGELPGEQVRDVLDRLLRNAGRLSTLLTDMLELDRLARGAALEPRRAPTDLAALVGAVIDGIDVGDRLIETDLEPITLAVEPSKVERVVENLLTNALRHTDASIPVWIRLYQDGDGVRLSFEDAGPGVPDDRKQEIFAPFTMGSSDASKVGGSGVGLALVDRFVAMHDGRAWVEDRPGGGAAFQVWLPEVDPAHVGGSVRPSVDRDEVVDHPQGPVR